MGVDDLSERYLMRRADVVAAIQSRDVALRIEDSYTVSEDAEWWL